MRSTFFPKLVDGANGDPALYVRIAHRREALLFDCGSLLNLPPREMSKIGALFVSHAHVDHLIDFDRMLRFFLYTGHRLQVFGPPGIGAKIGNRLGGYTWNLTDGFPFVLEVTEWDERESPVTLFRARNAFRPEPSAARPCISGTLLETPHYRVAATPLEHGSITSLAYTLEETLHVAIHKDALDRLGYHSGPWLTRFKDAVRQDLPTDTPILVPTADGDTPVPLERLLGEIAHTEAGMKVCYVTDASPTEENIERIVELSREAHLLVIEAPFSHADLDRAQQRNHLTAHLAGDIARRAGVQRCLFFHFSPRYQNREVDLEEEAARAFRGKGG